MALLAPLRPRALYAALSGARKARRREVLPMPDQPPLPPEAQRALAEAEARRKAARPLDLPPEKGGRNGPEPVRYGDYELNGRAVDF